MRFDFSYFGKLLGWMGGLLYLADVGWFAYDGSNIDYCHHPDKGAGIECYPISFTRCSVFERDTDERIERRRAFFSQFDRYRVHAELIAQRR